MSSAQCWHFLKSPLASCFSSIARRSAVSIKECGRAAINMPVPYTHHQPKLRPFFDAMTAGTMPRKMLRIIKLCQSNPLASASWATAIREKEPVSTTARTQIFFPIFRLDIPRKWDDVPSMFTGRLRMFDGFWGLRLRAPGASPPPFPPQMPGPLPIGRPPRSWPKPPKPIPDTTSQQ